MRGGQETDVQDCLAAKPALGQVLKHTDFPLDPDSIGQDLNGDLT